mgnify:CR=1 FL=1
MSRVGNRPIEVPSDVKVQMEVGKVLIEGPKGRLEAPVPAEITLELKDGVISAKRDSETPRARSRHAVSSVSVNPLLDTAHG